MFHVTEIGRHFAATRHVLWALKYTKMRLRPTLDRKRIFGVFRAQGTCLVAANVSRWGGGT